MYRSSEFASWAIMNSSISTDGFPLDQDNASDTGIPPSMIGDSEDPSIIP